MIKLKIFLAKMPGDNQPPMKHLDTISYAGVMGTEWIALFFLRIGGNNHGHVAKQVF